VDVYLGAWAPDGTLFYSRPATGPPDLYQVGTDGSEPRAVLEAPGVQLAQDWSAAGDVIAYLALAADRTEERNIWLRRRNEQPRRLRQTPANTFDSRFSPDGRLLAYASDESGTPEVYVTSLDGTGQARRLSRAGGFHPRWRGDGRELFYLQPDGALMAVDPAAEPPQPRQLFRIDGVSAADAYSPPRERYAYYDVTRDGQRFLVRLPEGAADRSDDLRVWIDWAAAQR
jgi:Tol biopolymer transport system component